MSKWPAIVAALAVLTAVGVWGVRATTSPPVDLVIGTGGVGGTYLPLGTGIADVFNRSLAGRVRATAIETAGSSDNVARLESGEAQLAIVQNDTEVGPEIRAIAPLYPEVLHVVVRADAGIASLSELRGRNTSAGPEGSGTDQLAQRVLAHFGMEDVARELIHASTSDAVDRLERGELDAAFLVSGLKSSAVARLLAGDGRLLSLGDPAQVGSALDGLRVSHPFLARTVIPARTYGMQPAGPVGSVAVQAVLVVRADLDASLVYDMTASLFDNRVALMKSHRAAAHVTEQFDPSALQAPLHDGADRYYRRDAPPVYAEYAELMSLLFTVALALGSGMLAFRRWMQRTRKDRIDVYYIDIHEVMARWAAGEQSAEAAIEALSALRARAFTELVDERLSADQSFTIFQDYVTSELRRLERQAARRSKPPPGS